MGKKLENHTVRVLKAERDGEPIPSAVFLPPALRDQPNVVYGFSGELPDVKQNLIRIQNEADPVGMLIAIAMGQPIATHTIKKVQDGTWTIVTKYETLDLNNPVRVNVIKHLSDKVIPRISVRATQGKKGAELPSSAEWEATIGGAADRHDDED